MGDSSRIIFFIHSCRFEELRRNNLIKFEEVVLTKDVMSDNAKKSTISQYFTNSDCIVNCGRQTKNVICEDCKKDPQKASFVLSDRMRCIERKFRQIEAVSDLFFNSSISND